MRDHLGLFVVAMAAGCVALELAGFWTWNSWLRLGAVGMLMLVCTRLLAPVYFGWREPEDYPQRNNTPGQ